MRQIAPLLALAALLSFPLFAEEVPTPTRTPAPNAAKTKAATKSAKQPAAKAGSPGTANMIVTRDPETGELRPATAAEREKLLGRHPQAAPEHKVVTLPDGSVMVELGEAAMSYAVATRAANGTISTTCVHGDAEARKAVSTPAPAPAKPADR